MNPGLSVIEDLFRQIIGPFAATQIGPLIIESDHIEDRVLLLAQTFQKFPHLEAPFIALIRSMNPQEAHVSLEEHIRFFTTTHTRNWLIVNLMNSVLDIKELRLDVKTGRLPAKPQDLIKFANQSRKAFGEESRYKDLVFGAGLLFDFIYYLQRTNIVNIGQMKFDEPVNRAFSTAMDQGKLILRLAKHKPKLSLERYSPLTAYFRQLAQISMIILRPSDAPEFYKKFNSLKHTESVRLGLERKKFGVHTGIVSSYLAQSLEAFAELGEAMSIWGFPYLGWLKNNPSIHDLAGMGMLGVALNERLRGADFPGEGKVRLTIPELEHLNLELTAKVKNEAKI